MFHAISKLHNLDFLKNHQFHFSSHKVKKFVHLSTMLLVIHLLSSILIFFAAVSIIPRACTWSRFIATLLQNSILSSAHITSCMTHSAQVLLYHMMWSMRSFAHLNCLLHGEQLFASSGLTSPRWLFLYLSSSSKWHSSLHKSQEKVILSLALSPLSLLSALSNVTQHSTNVASTYLRRCLFLCLWGQKKCQWSSRWYGQIIQIS